MSEAPAISVRGLTKRYGEKVVVDGLDLDVARGQIHGFLGPNGSGKTTTIRMLCGLLTPDSGEGRCLGYDIRTQQEEIKLTEKLQTAQARLNELQASKEGDQKFILSPEQKTEIEKFRQEQFQTQQELKQVRKNLRSDIEVLGLKLKAVNMALVPGLIAVFGLAHGWRRRKKAMTA